MVINQHNSTKCPSYAPTEVPTTNPYKWPGGATLIEGKFKMSLGENSHNEGLLS